jgi:hypothetical protein
MKSDSFHASPAPDLPLFDNRFALLVDPEIS